MATSLTSENLSLSKACSVLIEGAWESGGHQLMPTSNPNNYSDPQDIQVNSDVVVDI